MNQIEQRDTESQILLLENMCSAIFSVFSFFFVRYLNKRSFVIACDSYCAEFYAEIFLFFQFNAVISLKLVYSSELFVQLFANFLFFCSHIFRCSITILPLFLNGRSVNVSYGQYFRVKEPKCVFNIRPKKPYVAHKKYGCAENFP